MAERAGRRSIGFLAASFYLLNPGVLFNSSVWGQFDSIPATMLLAVIFLFELNKRNAAALLFLVAVLTKPQSGLLVPMVLYLYFKDFKFDWKNIKRLFFGIIAGIGLYLAIVLPFLRTYPALRPLSRLFWIPSGGCSTCIQEYSRLSLCHGQWLILDPGRRTDSG